MSHSDQFDPNSVFDVVLKKSSRGLGLSVIALADLVRVRKLYPLQPASQSGCLQLGDVILYANGNPLTGLTTNEALEVLRSLGERVVLTVFRPPSGVLPPVQVASPTTPLSPCLLTVPTENSTAAGEFGVTLTKIGGSLGFTLRKQDDSVLGHYIRALVEEPALTDGRLKAGDRILAVNGRDLSGLSHSEAVTHLRNCPDTVTLKLYRDPTQTPVSPGSPTDIKEYRKAFRKEAVDMLTDLAIQRSSPNNSPIRNRKIGSATSPLRRSKHEEEEEEKEESVSPDTLKERPSFLNLSPKNQRKQKYMFSPDADFDTLSLSALSTSNGSGVTPKDSHFSHNRPPYQSVNISNRPQETNVTKLATATSEQDIPGSLRSKTEGKDVLLKWRGSVFQDDSDENDTISDRLTVELAKGWRSRMGFSIKPCPKGSYISAIYPNSVASSDGRLKVGDVLLTVNGEDITEKPTSEVIDLMRKVGGKVVVITVQQQGHLVTS